MSGRRALRACMQVLVLLNLAFVQLTGIAGWHWLGPLYVLTLGAPLWAARRDQRAYRWLWNLGVVGFFAVLLGHARQANLAYVLEDGLVLAVLCQVHLLNNLREDQRPDLLFWNAFLVAITTGFLTRTYGFALGFLVFAPVLVIGLQLLSATRGGVELAPAVARRLALDGGRRALLLLGVTGLAFLFWPRDFQRKAFLHANLQLPGGPADLELGFNEVLELARNGRLDAASRPVMRVTLLEGDPGAVPSLWRGATLGATEGGSWKGFDTKTMRVVAEADERWRGRRGRLARGEAAPGATRVTVQRLDPAGERLFVPLGALSLELDAEHSDCLLRAHVDGNVDADVSGSVGYELVLAPQGAAPAGLPGDVPAWLKPYVRIERSEAVAGAEELAARIAKSVPEGASQHEIVARLCELLEREHPYLAPGAEGAAGNLNEFLERGAGGHCEFFASALATTLRLVGIPCRVVTGYRGSRWDAEGRVLSIETRDAHAWVEVYDLSAGWSAVDPSPAAAETLAATGFWARVAQGARTLWAAVTGFDQDRRAKFIAWARTAPARLGRALQERPLPSALLLATLGLALFLSITRRRRAIPSALRGYARALRRAHLWLLPGETPRELLERARSSGLAPEPLEALSAATRMHEASRYAA